MDSPAGSTSGAVDKYNTDPVSDLDRETIVPVINGTRREARILDLRRSVYRPALVYLAGQLAVLGSVAAYAFAHGRSLANLLTFWDGQHFIAIAQSGYTHSLAAKTVASPAFFPGLPLLMRWLSHVSELPLGACAIAISVTAGLAFAYGLVALISGVSGASQSAGLILVGLVSVSPLSIVLLMAYSESLFCALAAWTLWALTQRYWVLAGLLTAAAGLVRSTDVALVVAVLMAAALLWSEHRDRKQLLLGSILAPLGVAGYIGWVAFSFGDSRAWFTAQKTGWNTQFDFGLGTAKFIGRTLFDPPDVLDVAVVLVVAASIILLILLMKSRAPTTVLTYTAVVIALNIGSDGIMNSKIRLMVPAFALLIPVALWLVRQSSTVRAATFLVYTLAGLWLSAYALVVYKYSI